MALGKRRKEEEESNIDMTPMLDVVFIMLIFFIVTASFVNESGLMSIAHQPLTSHHQIPKTRILCSVFLRAMSSLLKDDASMFALFVQTLNVCMQRKPEAKVIVSAHPKSKTEIVCTDLRPGTRSWRLRRLLVHRRVAKQWQRAKALQETVGLFCTCSL